MSTTVIEHVLSRLKSIGISHVFGVAGDYAFPVEDAIVAFPGIEWVGCCNDLNVAYAADGYARIHGIGAVSTTYGLGELSALNGVCGAHPLAFPRPGSRKILDNERVVVWNYSGRQTRQRRCIFTTRTLLSCTGTTAH